MCVYSEHLKRSHRLFVFIATQVQQLKQQTFRVCTSLDPTCAIQGPLRRLA